MRVAFFGTPLFAVPSLRALLSRHRLVGVVTQPDRPSGRGQRVVAPPVKQEALAAGLEVSQPVRLKDEAWLQHFRSWNADLAVVAAYGKLLPQVLLDVPPRGFLNVHASLLPRYRGAAPIHRAVMNGERQTGITIMRVVLALDAGPMLAARPRPIGPDEPADAIEEDIARLGASLLLETLDQVEGGTATEVAQDDGLATYAPRLTKEEGLIDWTQAAPVIHNRVRGLRPWPQAYTFLDGQRLVVLAARASSSDEAPAPDAPPGTIVVAHGDCLRVATGERGALDVLQMQLEGRRPVTAREFLAGHRVAPGAVLGGPSR